MSDVIPPPKPTLEQTILSIFTPEQMERIIFHCKEVMTWGHGRVEITFLNGHPDLIEPTLSEKLPKPTNYNPE